MLRVVPGRNLNVAHKTEETPARSFERRIRSGSERVIDKALHPRRHDAIPPLSCERLLATSEYDRRLLGVCAEALAVCRGQEITPVEDILDMFLSAYGRGEMHSEWEEIQAAVGRVKDQIAAARLMLVQFPEEVLGPFSENEPA
jgi:hypothetical protein